MLTTEIATKAKFLPLVADVLTVAVILPIRFVAVERDVRRLRRVGAECGALSLSAEEGGEGGDD